MIEYTVKVNAKGDKFWYVINMLHRDDGPAVEYANGDKFWYVNGKRHREDGPAVEYANGTKEWFVNDKRHRIDGPAIEWYSGDKFWYIDDVQYTETSIVLAKPAKELTIDEIEKLLGYTIKIVK